MVPAGAHRRDLGERGAAGEVGRGAHAPLERDPAFAGGAVDALLPVPGASRFAAQSADPEEDLDQPVVLEGLDPPGDALVEPPLVGLGGGRRRVRAVEVHRDLRRDGSLGGQVTDVGDQRRVPQPTAQCRDPVGQDVVAGFPGDHGAGRDGPLVGVERPRLDVGVEPRVELHRSERNAPVPQVVDRGDDRRRGVRPRFGPVPVGGAVVGPVGRPAGQLVGPAAWPDGPGPLLQQRSPGLQAGSGAGAGEHAELGAEPARHPVQVPVPTDADRPAVEPDRLLVEILERGEHHGAS